MMMNNALKSILLVLTTSMLKTYAQTSLVNSGDRCDCCYLDDTPGEADSLTTDGSASSSETACKNACTGDVYWFVTGSYTDVDGVTQDLASEHSINECNCYASSILQTHSIRATQESSNCQSKVGYTTSFPSGMYGDPHILKWNGSKYSFHGECDLVLVSAPEFADGLGLDIHVRTKIEDFYSYIEAIAVRTGDVVVNVDDDGFWIQDSLITDFPLTEGALHVTRNVYKNKLKRTTTLTYTISIKNFNEVVSIKVPTSKHKFVKVGGGPLFGYAEAFLNSKGLMGEYGTGKTYGRDGLTEFVNMVDFGMEWQVQPHEDMLFMYSREPQLPDDVCIMPTMDAKEARRTLRSDPAKNRLAAAACQHVHADMIELCVEDVLATGNTDIADGY